MTQVISAMSRAMVGQIIDQDLRHDLARTLAFRWPNRPSAIRLRTKSSCPQRSTCTLKLVARSLYEIAHIMACFSENSPTQCYRVARSGIDRRVATDR
jgi:hypothetical protein